MARLLQATCVACVSLSALVSGQGVQTLVVGSRQTSGGPISFQQVEEFQINQSLKIRLLPESNGNVDQNAIRRLKSTEVAQAGGVIRNDGSGRLVRLDATAKMREIVLPDNYQLKAPTKASDVPGRLALTLVHSKKAKQTEVMAPEVFFALVTGPSQDRAVLDFVSNEKVFLNLEEQFAAIEGFVNSFRTLPAADEYRVSLERKLSGGVAAFEDGGTYTDLLTLDKYGKLGTRAFPADAPLKDLAKQIVDRIDFVEARLKLLRSLAVAEDWDALLNKYSDFERYQKSFPDVMALRREALEESAHLHSQRAREFALRDDHELGAKEATAALARDPNNKEIADLLDGERGDASKEEAKRLAAARKILPKGSAQERRFNTALYDAKRAIDDKEFTKAQLAIQDADKESQDAPEVLLMRARLLAAQDRYSEALPLLDRYDRLVDKQEERDNGDNVRREVRYNLNTLKERTQKDIAALKKSGEYSKLDELMKTALKADPNDPNFLFEGGFVAGALRDTKRAQQLMTDYLDRSNSLEGDPNMRDRAGRIRNTLTARLEETTRATAGKPGDNAADWLSGKKLASAVYYSPESLAFQIPIESVIGNKVHMNFTWDNGKLRSIRTTFEDVNAVKQYRLLATPGAPEAGVSLAPAGEDEGSFYFDYLPPAGQLRGIKTKAPAVGVSAAGAVAGRGPAGARGAVPAAGRAPVAGRSPAAGAPARAGVQNPAPQSTLQVRLSRDDQQPPHLIDDNGEPLPVFPSSPFVDVGILSLQEGAVGTAVAGNSFFNPFLWDGVHYFTVQYDSRSRAESAQEWGVDNLLRFTWDGDRLTEIKAFRKDAAMPYYHRTLTYMGTQIIAEEYSLGGHAGKIRYEYAPGKLLKQITVDNDGKSWIVKPKS